MDISIGAGIAIGAMWLSVGWVGSKDGLAGILVAFCAVMGTLAMVGK